MNFVQTESLFSKKDVLAQGAISCRFGVFIGDLLLSASSGSLRVLQLKQDIVPHAIHIHDPETAKDPQQAHTCDGWFEFALQKGYHMSIEECFPRRYWDHDFDTVDYQDQLNSLRLRMDVLDTVNMLDAEFVASLQSGGAAYSEIASQVATEAGLRQSADDALDLRLDACEQKSSYLDPTTQTLLTAESTSRIAADDALDLRLDACEQKSSYLDPTTQTLLTAESTSRIAADDALDLRLDACEQKSSYLDPTTQTLLTAESTSRAAADSALDVRVSACESTDATQSSQIAALQATSSVVDPTTATAVAAVQASVVAEGGARLAADTSLSAEIQTERSRVDSILHLSADHLNTFKEIEEAYKAADSNAHSALSNLVLAANPRQRFDDKMVLLDAEIAARQTTVAQEAAYRKISDSYTKSEVDASILAVQNDVDQNEADADSAIALRALASDTYSKAEVDASILAVQNDVDQNETDADAAIALRALASDTYSKGEVDAADLLRVLKADYDPKQLSQDALISTNTSKVGFTEALVTATPSVVANTAKYSVSQVDTALSLKANQSTTYSKTQVDTSLALKQDILQANQLAVVNANAFSTGEKSKVAHYDVATNLSTLLSAKAETAAPSFSGISVFTNTASDQDQLRCFGGDGSVTIQGGTNLNFTRVNAAARIRNTSVSGWLEFEAGGSGNKAMTIASTKKITMESHLEVKGSQIDFSGLPTSDPGVTGRLWNSSGTLKISA